MRWEIWTMKRVKKAQGREWRGDFLFIGNNLSLDFLNTRPVQNNEPTELLTDFAALLRWFEAAKQVSSSEAARMSQKWGNSPLAQQVVKAMRQLREWLRAAVLVWEGEGKVPSATMRKINRLIAKHPMRLRLKTSGTGYATELWFEALRPDDLYAPLAHSAASLFADVDRQRVRKCGQCILHFHDTSKKGTRRWCSMQLCGNRLKVAAYAARHHRKSRRQR